MIHSSLKPIVPLPTTLFAATRITMHHTESDIRSRLLVARLPAMPQILLKLLEHCQNDDAGTADLASLIAKDPGITSKIFAVANSSAYHRSGVKLGLEQALSVIGTDMVKTLVISESVFQIFNNFSRANSTDLRSFWKHSLSAAVIAREIATRMQYPHVEEAYLAGLLHDVGRLALLAAAPKEYAASFNAADDASLCALEQRTLQVTHAEAGAWIIERWHLDSFLADSVLYHHETMARVGNAHPLIRIVVLAHLLSSHRPEEVAVIEAGLLCGIDAAALTEISTHAVLQVHTAADHLGIDLTGLDDLENAQAPLRPPVDPVQERLSEEVRNLVLASNIGRTFSGRQSEDDLLETVLRSARILFGFTDAVSLQMDDTGQFLVGRAIGVAHQRLTEFSVALDSDSALALAATACRPAYVRRSGKLLSVGEEQLLRMLASSALVILPLASAGRCSAVLVGGIGQIELSQLQQRERFLQAFAAQASSALIAMANARSDSDQRLASAAMEYRDASRRVAHEVNNPLAIIKNYLSVLDAKLLRQEPVAGEMSILNEEIDRVGQIVNSMADLQLTQAHAGRGSDVNQIAESVVQLFQNTASVPATVRIMARLQDHPGEIAAGSDVVRQILMNLLKNAVEAMPVPIGGKIEIANRGIAHRDGKLYLALSIRDNGPGIPNDILATLFTPGRSTKSGPNRGQGLAIVNALVRQIDGMITCRSNKDGTSFELLLPIPKPERADASRVYDAGSAGPGSSDISVHGKSDRAQMIDSL